MNEYLDIVNSPRMYLLAGIVILYITAVSLVFLVKSIRHGQKLGMDKAILKKSILSGALFSIVPSVSVFIGVIALSGTMGVPYSWMRLSVLGSLQYELNAAEIAAQSVGLSGLKQSEMSIEAFTDIAVVVAVSILGCLLFCIFALPAYLRKISPKKSNDKKSSSGNIMIFAFIGICAVYLASYAADAAINLNVAPLITATVSAIVMTLMEYLSKKKNMEFLDNFSVPVSMLAGMAVITLI